MNDPFIEDIDQRICKLLGIHGAYSEVLQGQYYEVGQEFKAHTDFFEPHEFKQHCSVHGQRTYTVMIYLNDVEEGGETCFHNVNAVFKPVTGQAVIWNSLNPDGTTNAHTLHQARPVEKGFKSQAACTLASPATHPVSYGSVRITRLRISVMSSIAKLIPSRPKPLSFTPPYGILSTRHEGISPITTPPTSSLSQARYAL